MKHVTDQRKRKRWLTPLALCLAVCLAMQPVCLNVVQAAQSDVDAFLAAAGVFWENEIAFGEASDALWSWGSEEEGITGAMQAYYDAQDNDGDIDAAREAVYTAQDAFNEAYSEVGAAFNDLTAKFNALSDEEKEAKDEEDEEAKSPQEMYDEIKGYVDGDLGASYQDKCNDYEAWNYWDIVSQFWVACDSFGPASDKLYGNGENGIAGAIPAYNDAVQNDGDIDAAYKVVLEAADGMKEVLELIDGFYAAIEESYGKIPDDVRKEKDEDDEYAQSIEESYSDATNSKEELGSNYENTLKELSILKYTASNNIYWKARELFGEATNNFEGNEQQGITGALSTYEDARESGAEDLNALYEEVLAAQAAVENAYKSMTEKYQAANAAYAALTEAEQQSPYGNDGTVLADIHAEIVADYTIGWVPETHDWIHECEIPAPIRDSKIEEYIDSNGDYWNARDLFWNATNKFQGNEQEDITGALPTYEAALESESEELDALYEEVLAAQAAVENAYETMTEKYQAANAAYAALTEAEQQSPYGNDGTVLADIHAEIVADYTIGWVPETHDWIHECEIPAPPQKEEPEPTTPPSGDDTPGTDTPGTDKPGSGNDVSGNDPGSIDKPGTDKPGTDTPGTDTPGTDTPGTDTPGTDKPGTDTPGSTDKPGNSGTSNSTAPATNHHDSGMQSAEQAIAAAQKGSTVKIVTTESVTLTSSVLKALINNPTISLYLEYTYNGKDYKVLIPAGKAFVVEGIEYYGPLYLYSLFPYDGSEVNANALEYTIVKGDTLSKIAKKNNTTVSELVKLNRIKNPNRIRAGQKIVLPAK